MGHPWQQGLQPSPAQEFSPRALCWSASCLSSKNAFLVMETKRALKLQPQQTNKLTFNGFPFTFVIVLAEALPESFNDRGGMR